MGNELCLGVFLFVFLFGKQRSFGLTFSIVDISLGPFLWVPRATPTGERERESNNGKN